jgi:hypothetical protein
MKQYFIPAAVLLLTSCNSGKNDKQKAVVKQDSLTIKNDSATITIQPQDKQVKLILKVSEILNSGNTMLKQ